MKRRNVMGLAMVVTVMVTLAAAGVAFAAANNVMNANVTHGITGFGVDQPFGHITVCVPGTTTCQIVGGLLIDTGSFGLRIFAQALNIALPVQTSGPDRVAECAFFGSLTAWGRVATADVKLGGEPKISNLPVQVINPAFPSPGHRPAACNGPAPIARNPQQVNFNGILGVGLKQYDGAFTNYYACTSTTCTPIAEPLALQVQNPVALLPGNPSNGNIPDDNGVLLRLTLPPITGAPTLTGQLIFGINTQTNNQIPTGLKVYTADPATLSFTTTFHGSPVTGFIDSGSNGFFYANPNLPVCPGSPWYCPAALTAQRAINTGSDLGSTGPVNFNIANAFGLFLTGNAAFSDLGANVGGGMIFDWGLPFFFGRKVFVGIEGKSIIGVNESTPLWAYR
jgi:Protein of unknown function (DUF3443)